MALDTRIVATCDPCEEDGVSGVPAAASHRLALDGGPEKEVDFCVRDALLFRRLLEVYEKCGRKVPVKEEPAPPKKPKAKVTKKAEPKELPPTLADAVEKPSVQDIRKMKLRCPLPHRSTNGGPMMVTYSSRNTHAPACHDGAKVWDIKWEDPSGILTAFCTEHPQCKENGLGFINEDGLKLHSQYMRVLPSEVEGSDGQTGPPSA